MKVFCPICGRVCVAEGSCTSDSGAYCDTYLCIDPDCLGSVIIEHDQEPLTFTERDFIIPRNGDSGIGQVVIRVSGDATITID